MKHWIWILALGFPLAAQETESESPEAVVEIPESLSSPRATMRTFLTSIFEVKQDNGSAMSEAVACLNLSEIDPLLKDSLGRKAAEDLSMCIDRIAYVVYDEIPDEWTGQWVFNKETYTYKDTSHTAIIAIGPDQDGAWKFTPETVASVAQYRLYLLDRDVVEGVVELETWETKLIKKHPWLADRVFLMQTGQWLLLILTLVLAIVVERIVNAVVRRLARVWMNRQELKLSESDERSLRFPIRLTSYAFVFFLGLKLLRPEGELFLFLLRVTLVAMAVGVVWGALNVIDVVSSYFHQLAAKSENKFDDLLVPLIHKTAKVLVSVVGLLFIAQSMGSDLTALLTGLGIGGLAMALAAKDTLANFFGSLTVLVDRPFQIGDWINTGGVEGSVEEVGFRSTRIRTFYDSVITVPNSNLTNQPIDNYGRRQYRRFNTKVGVTYDTPPERIEAFCEGIRQIILAHQWTRKDYFHVYLNNMGSTSLEILLYVFWEVPDWSKELLEKHRLLIDIIRLGKDLGVEFAFPTQTLHLYQEQHAVRDPLAAEAALAGMAAAERIAASPISSANPRSGAKDGKLPDFKRGI